MELNAESRNVCVGDAFAGVVVYVGEALLCVWRERGGFYSVAVVLACDVNAAGFCVFTGVVADTVAVF